MEDKPPAATYFTGTTEKILEEHLVDPEKQLYLQKIEVRRDDTGELVQVSLGSQFQPLNKTQLLSVGKQVVLSSQQITPTERQVVITDMYRMPTIISLSLLFAFVVILIGRIRGLSALIGMAISVIILVKFLVPAILSGSDPIIVSLLGSLLIGGLTLYISHGFTVKSHIALAAMLSSLGLVAVLSYISVHTAQMFGLGSEEAYFLQFGNTSKINLQGLLLGGIILGALGVLDDITVSQVSVVFQLRSAKKDISLSELYHRGIAVGKDHVASLVNTLVLAYAGANLPLFLLFMLNNQIPTWVTLNSEIIVEEIIRTLTGSIGLVVAVPLATFLAAVVALRLPAKKLDELEAHIH
ncbi:YibE/F family protein [Candidatus Woesebacteria bacterium]|nr:YibE/F family protein [Candidatus Woesebacteria bacterium]